MTDSLQKQRPLRVLTLVDLIVPLGGAEKIASQVALALDRDRFEPAICVTRFDPQIEQRPVQEEIERAGISLIRLDRRGPTHLRPWRTLTKFMRDWEVDVVHAHKAGSSFWAALLAPGAGAPAVIAHEHGWSFEERALSQFVDRHFVARRADALVAVTDADRARMIAAGLPADKVRVIHNGIRMPPPPDPNRDVRRELGIEAGRPLVGIVATLRPEKALDVLIRATASLRTDFPDVAVLIVGSETPISFGERGRLEELISQLGLSDHVKLLGGRSDVPEILDVIDVAVLCSSHEASPLAVMEYMEAGKPVVATRVGGIPDMVEDGVTGLLVPPNDPEALAQGIAMMLYDPDRAARLGGAARERRRTEFSIEATARHFEDLYEELHQRKVASNGAGRG
jgi:glycosyltransferase involved in cell wall biosynthesis